MKARAPYGIRRAKSASLRGLAIGLLACVATLAGTVPAPAQPQATPFDPPDLACPTVENVYSDAIDLRITGGAWGGAPAGFVLQWMTTADWTANGWPADGATSTAASFCSATFTGEQYLLDEGELLILRIGKNPFVGNGVLSECSNFNPLACNTEYVFRAKALAGMGMSESPWSGTLRCSTDTDCANTAPAEPGELAPFDPPDLACPPNPWFPNTPVYSDALLLTVIGGGWGGAPAGFIIQWQLEDDFATHGWPADGVNSSSPSFCTATFTGPQYALDEDEAIQIQFGLNPWGAGVVSNCSNSAPLECGDEYVFRSMALGNEMMTESWWSGTLRCFVDCANPPVGGGEEPPPGEQEGCTYTQGYWKNHEEAWPVTELTLGTVTYTQEELLRILRQPVRRNGLVALAHQLIAAKLNVANGASDDDIAMTIEAADALIGSLEIPPIGTGNLSTSQTSGLVDTLTSFNEGAIGPGHCDDNGSTGSRRGKNKNK